MGVRITSVAFSNFMSSREEVYVNLAKRGLLLIEGENLDCPTADSNGSGKTMIFDAISFALYGKTARGISGDEVINREAEKDCRVTLRFRKGSEKYMIIREQKGPTGNSLELVSDSRETAVSKAKTQDEIIKLMGMSYETFMNCVMFGQRIEKFFTAETDAKQKEILEEILSLPDFSESLSRAKAEIKENSVTLGEILIEINTNKAKKDYTTGYIESEKIRQESFDNDIEEKRKEIASLEKELEKDNHEEAISIEKKLIVNHKALLEKTRFKEAHDKSKMESLRDGVTGLLQEIARLNAAITGYEDRKSNLIRKMAAARKLSGSCAVCGAKITKSSLEAHLSTLEDDMKEIIDALKVKEQELTDSKKIMTEKKKQLDALRDSIEDNTEKALSIEKSIISCEDRIDSLSRQFSYRHEHLTVLKSMLTETIKHQQSDGRLEALQKELTKVIKQGKVLGGKVDSLGVELRTLEFWVEGFGPRGIKSFVFDSVIPSLVDKANHYSRLLTGGRVWIDIATEKDLKNGEKRNKFEISANNMDGSEVYKGNSSGERRRIDLCILLSLHDLLEERVGNSVSILFFDEIFDSLDSTGSDSVMELLEDLSRVKESIVVITHNPDLKPRFENRLTIRKEGGVSRIVE